ncbi:hypothetical protein [Streptomyces noursei]
MFLDNLTSLEFTRSVNDTSTANLTITKDSLDDGCCYELGDLEPWVHEVSIYRDEDLVWQGPVITVTETREEIELEARDLSVWLERLANRSTKTYQREQADVVDIADYYIRWNLNDPAYSCPKDYPCLARYLQILEPVGAKPGYAPHPRTKYVREIIDELVKQGLTWTFIGRRMLLMKKADDSSEPLATLTTDDFQGNLQIIRDGMSACTHAIATNSTEEKERSTVTLGKNCTPYGRLDMIEVLTDTPRPEDCESEQGGTTSDCRDKANKRWKEWVADCRAGCKRKPGPSQGACYSKCATDYDKGLERDQAACEKSEPDRIKACQALKNTQAAQDLRNAVRELRKGRYPVPTVIQVDQGAALHPDAPIPFRYLIPGRRIDVRIDRACRKVSQAFVLSQVTVTWDAAGEKVGMGLTPLNSLDEDAKTTSAPVAAAAAEPRAVRAWYSGGVMPAPPAAAVAMADRIRRRLSPAAAAAKKSDARRRPAR